MQKTKAVRTLLIITLMLLLGGGVAYYLTSQATVTAYQLKGEVARYQPLTAEMLEEVVVSARAAETLKLISDQAQIVGQYAATPLQTGDVLQAQDVTGELPCDRPFASGRCLPPEQHPYALALPTHLSGLLDMDDLVNVWAIDAQTRQARILLQKKPLLDLRPENLFVAVTDDELATLDSWVNPSGEEGEQRRILVTITQATNPDFERLTAFPFDPATLDDARSFLPAELDQYLNPYQKPPAPAADDEADASGTTEVALP